MKINCLSKQEKAFSWIKLCLCLALFCGLESAQAKSVVTEVNQCDTTVYSVDTLSLCDNVFPYRYGDTTFFPGTVSGTFNVRFVKSLTRDSIVRLTLKVNPTYKVYDTLVVCQDDLPFMYGTVRISPTTPVGTSVRMLNLYTKAGCDSVVFLNLTVNKSYESSEQVVICDNQFPYAFGGRQLTAGGKYKITLQSVNGCDSVINLDLVANPSYARYDTVKICSSQLPYTYAGKVCATPGNYLISALTSKNCDSLVYLTLSTYSYPQVYDTLHLCRNALPYRYGPAYLMDQGTKDVALKSKEGCDSLVKVTVVVEPNYRTPLNFHTCSNYLPLEYGGKKFMEAGKYEVILQSIYGCDSVIDLEITIGHPTKRIIIYDTICRGEGYYNYGRHYTPSQTAGWGKSQMINASDPAANVEGCDSNYTIAIHINESYENYDSLLICEGNLPISRHGQTFNTAGNYTVNLHTVRGCDSTINFCLQTTRTYNLSRTDHFCAGSAYKIGDSTYKNAGDYKVLMTTAGGCDSIVNLHLIKDERVPYNPGQIYSKQDLYETDKTTFWISSVPNATFYHWNYTNVLWQPIGAKNDYVFALRNVNEGDTGTVMVAAGNACGLSAMSKLTIQNTGIAEASLEDVRVYPNPATDKVVVELGENSAESIEIRDVAGRLVSLTPVTDSRMEISLNQFSNGYYMIRIMQGKGVLKVLPLVKQ